MWILENYNCGHHSGSTNDFHVLPIFVIFTEDLEIDQIKLCTLPSIPVYVKPQLDISCSFDTDILHFR